MNGPEDRTDGVRVICSDQALPMRVVRLLGGEPAIVGAGGVLEEVSVALVDPALGDTVLAHAMETVAMITHRRDSGGGDGDGDGDGGKDCDEQA